jgi:hypothetical protein
MLRNIDQGRFFELAGLVSNDRRTEILPDAHCIWAACRS